MTIQAPFSDEQVAALNAYQSGGVLHPFTCPNHSHEALTADTDGWSCPACDYTQTWAHDFMANPRWLTRIGKTEE
jgi:hypothetical protein